MSPTAYLGGDTPPKASAQASPVMQRRVIASLLSAGTLGSSPAGALLSAEERQITALFERITPGVVSISKEPPGKDASISADRPLPSIAGSGFVWDKSHVVTNYHVINDIQDQLFITFLFQGQDGKDSTRITRPATVLGYDSASDVAVLQVNGTAPGEKNPEDPPKGLMQPLALGSSTKLLVGQNVLAFGNPFGLEHSLSRGIISGVSRRLDGMGGRPINGVIQTDASINPGNSGGPLLNSDGEVIGVNTAIVSGSGMFSGIGLAIPMDTVKRNVESIISKGFVRRPLLGIIFSPDVMSKELQLNGIMVMRVVPEGPAATSGLRPTRGGRLGDVVVGFDNKKIKSTDDLFTALEKKLPGDVVTLKVQRASQDVDTDKFEDITLKITLGEADR
eukprot:CAMPEP_0197695156 /NCGR_PEP_ID=MMETSP1338-20131121/114832_1 /TAXON_ID=43686 ORGANISM="Pelagodinium beii, Strain RCC1491" /NCGR_SAMPLE_ID=MMETSP1338 /ASSEMBLY_ACC=CAM_ASM_000754 /LENGTH=391 /DNA_ID=CAMNT_0043278099 /DNA_START=69 /DNA_END=1244 /DNA_ORIENTATION=+